MTIKRNYVKRKTNRLHIYVLHIYKVWWFLYPLLIWYLP